LAAYKYAFLDYAVSDEQAADMEYRGQSGAALRDRFRVQLGVTARTFQAFQQAALVYRQSELSVQNQLDAIGLGKMSRGPAKRTSRHPQPS